VNPKSQLGHTPPSQGADAAATARSQAGVSVLEDVRREARILRLLLGSDQPPLTTDTIDNDTCGLSQPLLHAIHLPANAVVQPGATNPLTIKQQFLDSIAKGKKSIAGFYDEVEAESFHYLISEYISGGDLFSVLTAQPQHKVSEGGQKHTTIAILVKTACLASALVFVAVAHTSCLVCVASLRCPFSASSLQSQDSGSVSLNAHRTRSRAQREEPAESTSTDLLYR